MHALTMTNIDFSPIVLTLKIFMNAVRTTTPEKERRTNKQYIKRVRPSEAKYFTPQKWTVSDKDSCHHY